MGPFAVEAVVDEGEEEGTREEATLVVFLEMEDVLMTLLLEEGEDERKGIPEDDATLATDVELVDVWVILAAYVRNLERICRFLLTSPFELVELAELFKLAVGCAFPAPQTMSACVASSGPSVTVMQPGSLAIVPVTGSLTIGG